ncbi:amino acid adenylation domain-containing protein [Dactylosporangium sp. AC04546]|uniref:amino acid adenylation domain-containing protein n=1 Tax=Dactylosporangium sp. AC04546 TaxID=2862460 RepID=UPI001EDFEB36|nr:amino acid adenylation domain-containing protein [Dactylosporangium sp. AC04546]WVK88759.1 amino acid adenylation domain-containing protein [Dactylosporangium sp. AC04546]
MTTVVELVRARSATDPDRVAVRWRAESVTYGELWRRAGVLAARLRGHGARPGDVVGLCSPRSADLVVGVLGILRAGCAYLPLDAQYPQERLRYMLEQASVGLLAGHRETAAGLAGGRTVVPLDGDAGTPAEGDDPPIAAGDVAYVMFTSGSTGVPKGVMQTHGGLANLVRWQLGDSAVGAGEVTVQFAPISFDVSFQEIFATLAAGGVLLCLDDDERRDPVLLWELLARERVARLYLPFVMLQTLALFADELPGGAPPLREVITAGEQLRCDERIQRLFAALPGCRLVNQYGPTETHVCTRYLLPADPAAWPLLPPIGTPVDGLRMHVLDADGEPVADGVPGELHVAGVGVARGYVGRPDLTAQRFRAEPGGAGTMYATGDVVERRDGQLHYLGRNDDQVKISGIRVEPAEVERHLLAVDGVREAAVVARKDPGTGARLVGFVTGDAGDEAGVRLRLAAGLPAHLVPYRIVALGALPTTPSGKLDRAALLDAARDPRPKATAPDVPDGLAAIWHTELDLPDGPVGDLRAAGVDSLAAARVAARIADRLGVLVPIDRVLSAASLDDLAAVVAAAPPVPHRADAPPTPPDQPMAASAMQQQLLVDELLRDDGPAQWVLAELDVTGPFDPGRAEAAIRRLTARHAALRSRFDLTGPAITVTYDGAAEPVVTRAEAAPADLPALRARLLADRYELGDVTVPVVTVVRLGDDRHRILLRLHHAVCDGATVTLLAEEFSILYRGETLPPATQPWQLPPGDDGADVSHWVRRLAPVTGRPPVDWGQPRGAAARLLRVPVTLDAAVTDAVRKRAREAGATPFAVLLAAWAGLFTTACVAVPVSTRTDARHARCAGLYLNTVVLPLDAATVERTQAEVAGALRYRTAPLPEVLRRLGTDRDAGYHPLAQMLFVLQPPGPRSWPLPQGARADLVLDVGVPDATRFDLVVNLDDRGERVTGWIDHDAEAVDADRVAALIDRWMEALQ